MGDRFKFRAWDTKNKKWLEFIPPREYMIDSLEWSHHDLDDCAVLRYPENLFKDFEGRIIYQQCTGLKDKNGKLIFEGDILRGERKHFDEKISDFKSFGECVGHIWYSDMSAEWIVSFNHLYSETSTELTSIWDKEVAGNIFENQELLKNHE